MLLTTLNSWWGLRETLCTANGISMHSPDGNREYNKVDVAVTRLYYSSCNRNGFTMYQPGSMELDENHSTTESKLYKVRMDAYIQDKKYLGVWTYALIRVNPTNDMEIEMEWTDTGEIIF